jgi:pimeloyl-ACP methyl ester carboxylesterase
VTGCPHFLFLHGYTSPWPKAPVWERLFREVGSGDVKVVAPAAPSGVHRRDPFNPRGRPSWFRYATDHSGEVPQQFDTPHAGDLHDVIDGPADTALLGVLERAVRSAGDAGRVALVGESQGGVVAAALALRWNLQHPDDHLGAVGLVRTAVDPGIWNGVTPPRFATRFHVLLGAADATFRPYFAVNSLGPLLEHNRCSTAEVPSAYRSSDGNVAVELMPGIGHSDSHRAVYRRCVALLHRDWLDGPPD